MESPNQSRLNSLKSAAPQVPLGILLLAIVLSGFCGGLIGYTVTDLQCSGTSYIQQRRYRRGAVQRSSGNLRLTCEPCSTGVKRAATVIRDRHSAAET